MCTSCAPLVADIFLLCFERDLMMSLSDDKQTDIIDALKHFMQLFEDILNINNIYF